MNYYAIGIGGTGAKCIETLTHLAAAGLMPDGELYMLFIDPDKANGSLERAQNTLQRYIDSKQLRLGNTDFLKTTIIRAKPDVWSPFGNETQPRLDNFFRYNVLKLKEPAAAHLFDVLYSRAEKETTLERGFRGHPSIGAAVMAKTVKLGEGEPWETFRNRIAQDGKADTGAKIFLFGSIFGGTGASGFPTIARLICNELPAIGKEKIKLGGALVLPYFSFTPDANNNELKASSENFLMNTQAALKYYFQQSNTDIYDAVYLVGNESLSPVTFSIGAKMQRNEPHFIELYAALAAIDFFKIEIKNEDPKQRAAGYCMIARKGAKQLKWEDLPDGNSGNTLKQNVRNLTRFAFAYLSVYYPMLEDIRINGKGYRAPWFVDFFERKKIFISDNLLQTSLERVKDYCESFLLWLANLQTSAKDEEINLVSHHAFDQLVKKDGKDAVELLADFRLNEFDNLILPEGEGKPNAISKIWDRMCNAKARDSGSDGIGVGRFIQALYHECSK